MGSLKDGQGGIRAYNDGIIPVGVWVSPMGAIGGLGFLALVLVIGAFPIVPAALGLITWAPMGIIVNWQI